MEIDHFWISQKELDGNSSCFKLWSPSDDHGSFHSTLPDVYANNLQSRPRLKHESPKPNPMNFQRSETKIWQCCVPVSHHWLIMMFMMFPMKFDGDISFAIRHVQAQKSYKYCWLGTSENHLPYPNHHQILPWNIPYLPFPGPNQGTVVPRPSQVYTADAAVHANAQQFADALRRQIVVDVLRIRMVLAPTSVGLMHRNHSLTDTQWIARQNMIL